MKKTLLLSLALTLLAGTSMFTMGAGRRTYVIGTAPAVYDTVVVIFTTQARVATAANSGNPAGVDTFAFNASADAGDQAHIVRMNNVLLGRNNRSWRADNADTAKVVRLGTGRDAPTFAYCDISKAVPGGWSLADANAGWHHYSYLYGHDRQQVVSGWTWGAPTPNAWNPSGYSNAIDFRIPVTNDEGANNYTDATAWHLFYVPFENHIPANVTVVNAEVNYLQNGVWYVSVGDSIVAVKLDQDSVWRTSKGNRVILGNAYANWANASWNRQVDTHYGAAQGSAWSSSLDGRTRPWNYGKISDWSGYRVAYGGGGKAKTLPAFFDITDGVQDIVSGGTNNGFAVTMFRKDSASTLNLPFHTWDTDLASGLGRAPYVVVRYITKKYSKPFGNTDLAYWFSTDDGYYQYNKDIDAALAQYGGNHTMFVGGLQQLGTNLTPAQMFELLDLGVEVGSHSYDHNYSSGFPGTGFSGYTPAAYGDATYNALVANTSPDWMYAAATAYDGNSRSGHRYFGKVFGANTGQMSSWTPGVLEAHGYKAYRSLGGGMTDNVWRQYIALPGAVTGGITHTDTLSFLPGSVGGALFKRNMYAYYPSHSSNYLFGHKSQHSGNDPAHLANVMNNSNRVFFTARGQNNHVVTTFTHITKPAIPIEGGYDDGANIDEISVFFAIANTWGAKPYTLIDLAEFMRSNATPVDQPFPRNRIVQHYADKADRIFFRPDGFDHPAIGTRWIPGLK